MNFILMCVFAVSVNNPTGTVKQTEIKLSPIQMDAYQYDDDKSALQEKCNKEFGGKADLTWLK